MFAAAFIPALRRQRQVARQLGLNNKVLISQCYLLRPCLKTQTKAKTKKKIPLFAIVSIRSHTDATGGLRNLKDNPENKEFGAFEKSEPL